MYPDLHSFLKSCTENRRMPFYANGDPNRPGDPMPAGLEKQQPPRDKVRPDPDGLKYVSPSYDDEEDEEEESG